MSWHQNRADSRDLSPKRVVAYYLLIIYVLATCKPVLPVVADVLAHTFWETSHIEGVHHDHGSHHLEIEISKAEKHEHGSANNVILKYSETVSLHLAAIMIDHFVFSTRDAQYLPIVSYNLYTTVLEGNYPPPKIS